MTRLMLASAAGLLGFYLLFSAVPVYVGDGFGAGMATGALMLGTMLLELLAPRLLERFGYRAVLAGGLVLLGAPALALPLSSGLSSELPLVLGVCLLRGGGLGVLVVAGTAMVAELVPAAGRARALGVYGVAVGVPSVLGLPLGLWAGERFGYELLFVVAGLVPLAGLPAVLGLPYLRGASREPGGTAVLGGGLVGPVIVFGAVTLATGVVVTFLPLAAAPGTAAVALLAQSVLTPAARWWVGRSGRRGLLGAAVVAVAAGTGMLAWSASAVAVVAGMTLFGIGFGLAQNLTLTAMFERGPSGRVSALWNLAYDAGMGAGALGVGVVIGWFGYAAAFLLVAVLVLATLPLARRAGAPRVTAPA
ncbi:MFS transporter [Nonomuraea sp. NBC_01738]|uniref:MFS transporter n=1 Tax=Nonomuraea sp. NBC_01738 TaxID=2976003 RepID=UPI002E0D42DC|nr:MFS transporter [Nonomuraea sp. NBC_01738]